MLVLYTIRNYFNPTINFNMFQYTSNKSVSQKEIFNYCLNLLFDHIVSCII